MEIISIIVAMTSGRVSSSFLVSICKHFLGDKSPKGDSPRVEQPKDRISKNIIEFPLNKVRFKNSEFDLNTIIEIDLIEDPEKKERAIRQFGMTRYMIESEAEMFQSDSIGELWCLRDDVFVRVINSTPEEDGSFNEYFLRVPPTVTTAKEAVAWTFNLKEEDYAPFKES